MPSWFIPIFHGLERGAKHKRVIISQQLNVPPRHPHCDMISIPVHQHQLPQQTIRTYLCQAINKQSTRTATLLRKKNEKDNVSDTPTHTNLKILIPNLGGRACTSKKQNRGSRKRMASECRATFSSSEVLMISSWRQ